MRLALKIAAGFVGIAVLAGIGLAAWLSTIDLRDLKGVIEREVESATGRRLTIAGDLDLRLSLTPRAALSDVTLANAAWGSEPQMASVGEVELVLDIVDLLGGRVDVERLLLKDVELLVETGPDGNGNWDIASETTGRSAGGIGPGRLPTLREVTLQTVRIRVKQGGTARTLAIETLELRAPAGESDVVVSLDGALDGIEVALEGTMPPLTVLAGRPGSLPVDLAGTVAGRPVTLAVSIEPGWTEKGIESVTFSALNATLGGSDMSGSMTLHQAVPRPRFEATLESRTIDLADLSLDRDRDADRDPLDRPIPYELLRFLDGAATVRIGRLIDGEVVVETIETGLEVRDGVLSLGPGSGVLGGGKLTFSGTLDGTVTPGAAVIEGRLTDADLGALAAVHGGRDEFRGRGDASWRLAGSGVTANAVLASAAGHTAVVVREGVIDNDYWELIAEDLAKQILPTLGESERGTLNCIASRFEIDGGIAESRVLLIDSHRVVIAGEGTVDLRARTLRLKLTPKPADPSLFSLATPILIEGPLEDPRIGPDPVGLAKGVGTLALGAVNPLALAVPLVSLGADDDACPVAIAIAEGRAIPETARSSGVAGGVGRVGDTLGKAAKDAAEGVGRAVEGAAEGVGGAVKGLFDKLKRIGD